MTFSSREGSRSSGQPFHLYHFKIGSADADVLRFTNAGQATTFSDDLYTPLAISHGDVVSAGNLDKASLTITVPDTGALADLYKDQPPSYVVTLIVYQGHLGDADIKVCWAGRVLNSSFRDEERQLDLECEPIVGSLRRTGLSRDYQYACPLALYGPKCRANKAAATFVGAVTSVNGPFVTLPGTWAPTGKKDKFVGGMAEWLNAGGRTERRAIIGRVGDVVQLSSFPTDLAGGTSISLILGCSHTMDDCRDVHNNILNFGGQPQIPLKNPVGITNNYY